MSHHSRPAAVVLFVGLLLAFSQVRAACGERVTLPAHGQASMHYALVIPPDARGPRTALVLLPGGGGHLQLDERACPRALTGNSLVRSLSLFQTAGFTTALVDAPTDHQGPDGLGGFRLASEHAQDLGRVVVDLRQRGAAAVWLVGTSRGAISAANAASRLSGAAAPDGLVLTSPVTSGNPKGQKAWVAQTVFDAALDAIRMPVLVVGHVHDSCLRSPAALNAGILERTAGGREQLVVVEGGTARPGPSAVEACEGRSPHGFWDQEAEVAAGMTRFIRGGRY